MSGGKGSSRSSSSRKATPSTAERQEWVPLLSEARAVLMAALVRESEASQVLVGVQHAAHLWAKVIQQARTRQLQAAAAEQGVAKGAAKGAASGVQQDTATGISCLSLLSCPVLNSFLAACVDMVQQQQQSGQGAEQLAAAAIAPTVEVLGLVPLLLKQQQQSLSSSSSSSSSQSTFAPLLLPDAVTYSLLLRLFGAAQQYSHLALVVNAAVRGGLRLAASAAAAADQGRAGWTADDLQQVVASAAAVWRDTGRTGLAVAMLDGLAAAGVTTLDNPQLAAEVEAAVEADVSWVLLDCCCSTAWLCPC
jgi:hypothetical protein